MKIDEVDYLFISKKIDLVLKIGNLSCYMFIIETIKHIYGYNIILFKSIF